MNAAAGAGDMSGKVCIVTGASRGIGRATAEGLGRLGASLVLVCRRREDGEAAASAIAREGQCPVPAVVEADLSIQHAVRAAARDIAARYPSVQVLIHNAGVVTRHRALTADGLETQLAVNHLAPFLLTHLLLPQLRAGAPSRVVTVSSTTHQGATIDFDDLQHERDYDSAEVYAETKLMNVLFTYELARRLEGTGVTANCLHPGAIATRLLADYMGVPLAGNALARTVGATPEHGADTVIYLAASPEVESVTGRYFTNRREVRSAPVTYDAAVARRLWTVSERLTGLAA
ncbi:MAG TPA: SDR family NAD(P)-dependent oxidoreductase [Gemmatimonadales bacterium]|nr:SDR family NAD(P)-dependent oxidoreductase [Gemmatimonadales bacterium]